MRNGDTTSPSQVPTLYLYICVCVCVCVDKELMFD